MRSRFPLILLAALSVFGGRATGETVLPSLRVERGAVNTVRLGGNPVVWIYRAPVSVPAASQRLLLTHGRRDVLPRDPNSWDTWDVIAPVSERALLTEGSVFWEQYRSKRFHDYKQSRRKS